MTARKPGSRPYRRHDGGPLRRCSRCHEPKPLDAFRRDSRGYVRAHCIACCLIDSQEWRARHHEALLARRRAAYAVGVGYHHGAATLGKTASAVLTRTDDIGSPAPCGETPK
jgi:hypothetical protein